MSGSDELAAVLGEVRDANGDLPYVVMSLALDYLVLLRSPSQRDSVSASEVSDIASGLGRIAESCARRARHHPRWGRTAEACRLLRHEFLKETTAL